MAMMPDTLGRDRRHAEEQQREAERASRSNVEVFTKMFLTLGADCLKIAGNAHAAELEEAKGLAAWRWNQLIQLEAQIVRETEQLAARPKTRPAQVGDDQLPDRTLAQRDTDWQAETKHRHVGLANLRDQAKRERAELESFVTKRR